MSYSITFFKADRPLTKHYALNSKNRLEKTSYPFVKEITSIEEHFDTLEELAKLLEHHSQQGHCMFKGLLTRPLIKESRAGLYHKDAPTWLLLLDLDGAPFNSTDEYMDAIDLGNVSYICQLSASAGLENKPGLRCHIYVLLAGACPPALAKLWLQCKNFQVKELNNALQLTASGVALRYTLDVSTMQNDKIIYLAPPQLGPGLSDPHPLDRIRIVHKTEPTATISGVPTAEYVKEQHNAIVNKLREASGLEARKKFKYKEIGTVEYLSEPGNATITGCRTERGFVYFNLNGGDSWAYYHPVENAQFVYNFKGEPTYKTSELLPDYWRSLKEKTDTQEPNEEGIVHIGFRDLRSSKYRLGEIINGELAVYPADSERQLRQWMQEKGRILGEVVPTWEMYYNPRSTEILDKDTQRINTFKPSSYMAGDYDKRIKFCPPTIERLFKHVLNDSDALLKHWYNWLAGIVQRREATGTAWQFQGNQGTGKGLTMQLLTEMIGPQNAMIKRMDELDSEFTSWMEDKLIILVDEMHAEYITHESKAMARIKSCITEPKLSVRRMYANAYLVDNYTNWLFASNMANPMPLSPDDRRFNIGNFQPVRFMTSQEEIDQMFKEIAQLYSFLMNWKIDEQALRTPLNTAARRELIEKNRVGADMVGDAVREGDLQFFWDQMPEKIVNLWATNRATKYDERRAAYAELVCKLVMELPTKLSRDQLQTLFMGCTDNVPETTTKFTRFAHHHGVRIVRLWIDDASKAGIEVAWQYDAAWLKTAQKWVASQTKERTLKSVA